MKYLYILLLICVTLSGFATYYLKTTNTATISTHNFLLDETVKKTIQFLTNHTKKKKLRAKPAKYHAQHGQDYYVDKLFLDKKLKKGTFVEVGALRGKEYSNTWYFEKAYDWTGILIEAEEKYYNELKKNRPLSKVYKKAACGTGVERVKFASSTVFGWGGIFKYYDDSIWKKKVRNIQEVECVQLNDILEENNMKHIDYMTIDVEGAELEIIKSIDFDRFNITYLQVERVVHNEEQIISKYLLQEHMKEQNYEKIKLFKLGHHTQDILFKKIASRSTTEAPAEVI